MGEETFRRGVRAYLEAHAEGNAVAADLWSALGEASGRDVAAVLSGFLDQPGYPLIRVERDGPGAVTLAQRRFLNAGVAAPDLAWRVPVVLKWSDGRTVHTTPVLLATARRRVELGPRVEWVHPDADARGYYRWELPEADLRELARQADDRLSVRERIALLGDARSLLDAGELHGDAYLDLVADFAGDADPAVIDAALAALANVESAFVTDALRDAFAAWVRRTLGPTLERFGASPRPGEPQAVALLRPRLLGWLGGAGRDPGLRAEAARAARRYLDDPSAVDPSLVAVTLTLAARGGDGELFDTFRRRFEAAEIPADRGRFLAALGAFDSPGLEDRALAYALAGPLRPNELFTIARGMGDTEAGAERVYAWATAHFADLTARIPPDFVAFMPFLASGCSAPRLEAARHFFAAPEHRVPGTEEQLARVGEQVTDCVALRRREGPAVAAYLEGAAAPPR